MGEGRSQWQRGLIPSPRSRTAPVAPHRACRSSRACYCVFVVWMYLAEQNENENELECCQDTGRKAEPRRF